MPSLRSFLRRGPVVAFAAALIAGVAACPMPKRHLGRGLGRDLELERVAVDAREVVVQDDEGGAILPRHSQRRFAIRREDRARSARKGLIHRLPKVRLYDQGVRDSSADSLTDLKERRRPELSVRVHLSDEVLREMLWDIQPPQAWRRPSVICG